MECMGGIYIPKVKFPHTGDDIGVAGAGVAPLSSLLFTTSCMVGWCHVCFSGPKTPTYYINKLINKEGNVEGEGEGDNTSISDKLG